MMIVVHSLIYLRHNSNYAILRVCELQRGMLLLYLKGFNHVGYLNLEKRPPFLKMRSVSD